MDTKATKSDQSVFVIFVTIVAFVVHNNFTSTTVPCSIASTSEGISM
jgi:hypothetical protein